MRMDEVYEMYWLEINAGVDEVDRINGMDGVDEVDSVDGVDMINGIDGVDEVDTADGVDKVHGLNRVDGVDGSISICVRSLVPRRRFGAERETIVFSPVCLSVHVSTLLSMSL